MTMAVLRTNAQSLVDGGEGHAPFPELQEGIDPHPVGPQTHVGAPDVAGDLDTLRCGLCCRPQVRAGKLNEGEHDHTLREQLAIACDPRGRNGVLRQPHVRDSAAVHVELPERRMRVGVGTQQRVIDALTERHALDARGAAALGIDPCEHRRTVEYGAWPPIRSLRDRAPTPPVSRRPAACPASHRARGAHGRVDRAGAGYTAAASAGGR